VGIEGVGAAYHLYGYGFLTAKPYRQQPLTRAHLADWYSGRIMQNNQAITTGTNPGIEWLDLKWGIQVGEAKGNPNVLSVTNELAPPVGGTCGQTLPANGQQAYFGFSALLLNQAGFSTTWIYEHAGHDWGPAPCPYGDGCYNAFDAGHKRLYYGIMEGDRVERMVFIENSSTGSPFPIIAVGWVEAL
jgi:hypothetical protein